jgi:hypothetical protein
MCPSTAEPGHIKAGNHTLTAEDPLPDDLRDALTKITAGRSAH